MNRYHKNSAILTIWPTKVRWDSKPSSDRLIQQWKSDSAKNTIPKQSRTQSCQNQNRHQPEIKAKHKNRHWFNTTGGLIMRSPINNSIPVNPSRPDKVISMTTMWNSCPIPAKHKRKPAKNAYIELLESQARWAGGAILGCNFRKTSKNKIRRNPCSKPANQIRSWTCRNGADSSRSALWNTAHILYPQTASSTTRPSVDWWSGRCIWKKLTVDHHLGSGLTIPDFAYRPMATA